MIVREHVPLSSLTTLKVGGPARYVIECTSEDDVTEALAFANERALPWRPLGDGSNVLASDDGYEGVVLLMRDSGMEFADEGESVLLTAASGVSWDALVRSAAQQGLWGIENLAGIPGTAGASPVQNIGAYGMEVKDTIESVRVLDTNAGSVRMLSMEECAFGYRDSRFKREPGLVILSVSFRLSKESNLRLGYKDLAQLTEEGRDLSTPMLIGEAVREIRARKFPDLALHGTAGSFFKNPTVPMDAYAALAKKYEGLPGFPNDSGVKVPLAFVLDRILNLRGHADGNVSLFERQPLVLVTKSGATAREVDTFASAIAMRVKEETGIDVEREVRSFP